MNAKLVSVVAAGIAAAVLMPLQAAGEVRGEQRILVVLGTWGPTPWDAAEVRRIVFEEADAFIRRSSFGQVSFRGDVTPWLTAFAQQPPCPPPTHETLPPTLGDPPREAARRAGYPAESYDRVVYVLPRFACPWNGVGVFREAMLNGMLSAFLVVHELGHTYGLAHARGRWCRVGACSRSEMGDPFSVMGRGFVDFSVYEKLKLGWVRDATVAHVRRSGSYVIERADVPNVSPQALVVRTGRGEYWLEHRLDVSPRGVAVRTIEPDVPDDDLAPPTAFLLDPTGRGQPVVRTGELLRIPGAFSARYRRVGDRAQIRFQWTDRTRPLRPLVVAPPPRVRAGEPLRVSWKKSRDLGSGVDVCTVSLDGRVVVRTQEEAATLAAPRPGAHSLAVSCADRAGNRSPAAVRRFQSVP